MPLKLQAGDTALTFGTRKTDTEVVISWMPDGEAPSATCNWFWLPHVVTILKHQPGSANASWAGLISGIESGGAPLVMSVSMPFSFLYRNQVAVICEMVDESSRPRPILTQICSQATIFYQ